MTVLGIDVGLTGALALVSDKGLGQLWMMEDMPTKAGGREKRLELDVDALVALMEEAKRYGVSAVVIEAQSAAPGQGLGSTFKLARQFGLVEGLARGLALPAPVLAPPSVWKAQMRLSGDKEQSRLAAKKLWPRLTYFDRAKDHGRAEAALLAHWWILARAREAVA